MDTSTYVNPLIYLPAGNLAPDDYLSYPMAVGGEEPATTLDELYKRNVGLDPFWNEVYMRNYIMYLIYNCSTPYNKVIPQNTPYSVFGAGSNISMIWNQETSTATVNIGNRTIYFSPEYGVDFQIKSENIFKLQQADLTII